MNVFRFCIYLYQSLLKLASINTNKVTKEAFLKTKHVNLGTNMGDLCSEGDKSLNFVQGK